MKEEQFSKHQQSKTRKYIENCAYRVFLWWCARILSFCNRCARRPQIFPVVILSDLLMGPELHKLISIYM